MPITKPICELVMSAPNSDDYEDDELWANLKSLKKCLDETPSCSTPPPNLDDLLVCENCSSKRILTDEGVHICLDCNTIQGRMIDMCAEWRYYGAEDHREDDPTRCGMPFNELLPQSSLGSMIGSRRNESREVRRIRMNQMWNSMPYWERTLYKVFDELIQNTSLHNIPSKVLNDAKVLYKKASEKKISRGDNKEGLIASCIYYACHMNNVPRSTKEVASMFHIDPNVLTKGNARFQILVNLNVKSATAEDFITRFGSKLNMNYDHIMECKKLAEVLEQNDYCNDSSPTSLAAGVIYFFGTAKNLGISKKDVSTITNVSEVTILKCFKRLQKLNIQFKEPN